MEQFTEFKEFIRDTHDPNKFVIGITFIQIFILISLLIHSIINKKYIAKKKKQAEKKGYGKDSINPLNFGVYIMVLIIAQFILGVFHFGVVNMFCENNLTNVAWFLVTILSFNLLFFNKYYHFVFVIFNLSFIIKKLYDKYM